LINLKLPFGMPDLWTKEGLEDSEVLIVPCSEYMDAESQDLLIKLVKGGKRLILFGLLPKYDLRMKSCELLAKSLKLKTKELSSKGHAPCVGKVNGLDQEFTTFVYGYIRGSRKSKVLASYDARPVGAISRIGKGYAYLFTFDISAGLNHNKLFFLEEVLRRCGLQRHVSCDHPLVDLVVQKNDRHTVLHLIFPPENPSPGSADSHIPAEDRRKLILKAEPRKLGIKGKRIRLVDLLGNEVIRTTPEELRRGIVIEMAPLDSRMYLLEGK
jgi:hypothetical protein